MYNIRVERSGGYAGMAFVFISLVGLFLNGVPPLITWPAGTIEAFVFDHRTLWLAGAWLTLPESAFFFWFLVQLRAYLRLVSGLDDGLPTYMLLSGVAAAILALVTAMLQAVLGFRPQNIGIANVRLLFDTYTMASVFIFIPLTVMVLAATHSARRHGTLPAWLVAFGYIAAAGAGLKSLSLFFTAGFMALGGLGTMVVGVLPLMGWLLAVSRELVAHPRGSATVHPR